MEKLMKIAQGLDVYFRIEFWAGVFVVAMTTINLTVLMFTGKNLSGENGFLFSLKISGQSVELANLSMAAAACWYVALFILLFLLLYRLRIIRRILQPMKIGKPFDVIVSESLRKLALLQFLVGIAGMILDAAAEIALDFAGNISDYNFNFDISFLIITFILLLCSYILRYGEELQRLSDETL